MFDGDALTAEEVAESKRTRRSSRRDAPTWQSASSVWRRSCPTSPSSPCKPNGSTSPSRRTNAPHRLCGRFARLRKASPSTARSTQSRATKRRTRGPSSTRARRTTRVAGCGRGDTRVAGHGDHKLWESQMNRQKSPNSKRAPTHKGVRLSSHLAQRARAEESLVDSDHDVGRLDDGDGLAAFLDGLEVPLIWLRAPIFMMRPFRLVRSRPHGSALLWWCRLSFGDTCIIA